MIQSFSNNFRWSLQSRHLCVTLYVHCTVKHVILDVYGHRLINLCIGVQNAYVKLLCSMYNVHVQCTMYNVQCTMYFVQCTMYNVQCTCLTNRKETLPIGNNFCRNIKKFLEDAYFIFYIIVIKQFIISYDSRIYLIFSWEMN